MESAVFASTLQATKDDGIRFSGGVPSRAGGGDSPADTPDPIPNSEVKRRGGDNTPRGKIARRRFFVVQKLDLYKIFVIKCFCCMASSSQQPHRNGSILDRMP